MRCSPISGVLQQKLNGCPKSARRTHSKVTTSGSRSAFSFDQHSSNNPSEFASEVKNMKTKHKPAFAKTSAGKQNLIAAALISALAITTARAQNNSAFDGHITLALADATSSGGGGAGDDSQDQQAELAKKLQNPLASLISVPIQNNWDFGIGPANAMRYTANIQPVVPISISKDWNLIIRTILPVIYAESPVKGGSAHSGLGDTTQSFFLSPNAPG